MARPKKDAKDRREKLSATVTNGIGERLGAIAATTGLSESQIVDRILLRGLPAVEADPSVLLRDLNG